MVRGAGWTAFSLSQIKDVCLHAMGAMVATDETGTSQDALARSDEDLRRREATLRLREERLREQERRCREEAATLDERQLSLDLADARASLSRPVVRTAAVAVQAGPVGVQRESAAPLAGPGQPPPPPGGARPYRGCRGGKGVRVKEARREIRAAQRARDTPRLHAAQVRLAACAADGGPGRRASGGGNGRRLPAPSHTNATKRRKQYKRRQRKRVRRQVEQRLRQMARRQR